jgi:hypothetical protein
MGRKPEKKWGTLFFVKKQVAKKRVIVIQKEKRQSGLFSFSITMTLFFAPCFLAKSRVPDFLKVPDPKKISGRSDKLNIRVQIDWASVSVSTIPSCSVNSSNICKRKKFQLCCCAHCFAGTPQGNEMAQTYLQPHYGNGVFGNVYLSAGQH